MVLAAIGPLGSEYCEALERGLRGRWCDRYENRGKQSGAFSAGSYDGDPYILMNYQPDVLDHVFTLAHEAGHSMHSYFSARNQPFQYYNYTIFVAEVASTFNEELLSRHLLAAARDDRQRAYLINRQIDAIRGTIFRQTMFAEFEKITHDLAEKNEPLTVDRFKSVYRGLLETYFGPKFVLGRRAGPGMFPHSALLPRLLRVQVRHRLVGGDRPGGPRPQGRPAGAQGLPRLSQGGMFQISPGPAPRRWRGHGATGPGGYGPGMVRPTGGRVGRAGVRNWREINVSGTLRVPLAGGTRSVPDTLESGKLFVTIS